MSARVAMRSAPERARVRASEFEKPSS
jgi:hypothetical protein